MVLIHILANGGNAPVRCLPTTNDEEEVEVIEEEEVVEEEEVLEEEVVVEEEEEEGEAVEEEAASSAIIWLRLVDMHVHFYELIWDNYGVTGKKLCSY